MNKVLITKYVEGKEIKSEFDYIPKEPSKPKGNVVKKLSKSKQKKLEKKQRNKERKKKFKQRNKKDSDFYRSREWLELRYRVLRNYEGKCMCCGQSPKKNKVILHVDHIKPRSKFPELELQYDNLQILCAACNRGKSNKDSTDWRTNVN